MGMVKVTAGGPHAQYQVQNTQQVTEIQAKIAQLADRRAILETELPILRNTVAQLWDETQVYRATVNALIQDWIEGKSLPEANVPSVTTKPGDADKQEVLRLVNEIRADNGLPPVTDNPTLATAAQDHADWMGANTVGHEGENGSRPAQRIAAAGYDYSVAAENVAAGQKTPAEVVQAWMNSPGHRANILSPDVTELGVGAGVSDATGPTWVQNFGAPKP